MHPVRCSVQREASWTWSVRWDCWRSWASMTRRRAWLTSSHASHPACWTPWSHSSSVGVLWCVLLMHWFSDLESRQTHRPPLAFLLKASALTQSVGSVMEVITPRSSIFSSSVLISSRSWMGYFHGGCTTGWASSWRVMWSSPSKSPIPLNLSGYRCLRSIALWIGWAAGDVAIWTMQCCHQLQLPAARQSQDRWSLWFCDKEIRAMPLSVLVFSREGGDTKLLYCGAIVCLQYGLSFLRSSLCWISVVVQFGEGIFGGIYGAGRCFLVLLCRPLLSGTPGTCTGCPDWHKVRHSCHCCSSRWMRIQGIPVCWQDHHRCCQWRCELPGSDVRGSGVTIHASSLASLKLWHVLPVLLWRWLCRCCPSSIPGTGSMLYWALAWGMNATTVSTLLVAPVVADRINGWCWC